MCVCVLAIGSGYHVLLLSSKVCPYFMKKLLPEIMVHILYKLRLHTFLIKYTYLIFYHSSAGCLTSSHLLHFVIPLLVNNKYNDNVLLTIILKKSFNLCMCACVFDFLLLTVKTHFLHTWGSNSHPNMSMYCIYV